MIYYITRDKNQNIFNKIANEKNIAISKNIKTSLRLDIFAKTEMRNLHAVTYLAIDINAVSITGIEELIDTLDCYHLLNPRSQVIIIANSPDIETALIFDLKRNRRGKYFLITEDEKEKLERELEEVFSEKREERTTDDKDIPEIVLEDNQEQKEKDQNINTELLTAKGESIVQKISEDNPICQIEKEPPSKLVPFITKSKEKSTLQIENIFDIPIEDEEEEQVTNTTSSKLQDRSSWSWNGQDVMIAFVGSENRVGTTTTIFQFADFLKKSNASVSYTEADESGHLEEMIEEYGLQEQEKNMFVKNDIIYCNQGKVCGGVNFILIDFGVQSDKKIARLKRGQFKEVVIISDYKIFTRNKLSKLELLFPEATFLFTFIGEQERELLSAKKGKDVFMLESSSTFMKGIEENDWIYEKLVNKYRMQGEIKEESLV